MSAAGAGIDESYVTPGIMFYVNKYLYAVEKWLFF